MRQPINTCRIFCVSGMERERGKERKRKERGERERSRRRRTEVFVHIKCHSKATV